MQDLLKLKKIFGNESKVELFSESLSTEIKRDQFKRGERNEICFNPELNIESDENWTMWGADKVYIKNFKKFCKVFNIDRVETFARAKLIGELNEYGNSKLWKRMVSKQEIEFGRRFKYVFYSKDKKLSFTSSAFNVSDDGCSCYFHYFGVTAELSRALKTFFYFVSTDKDAEFEYCWNGRNYI